MRNLYPKWLIATIVLATSVAPIPASANTPPAYQDLAQADAWATASIQETQRLGLMSGDGNGLFRPLATITREETAAVMLRALQLDSSDTTTSTFLDVPADAWSHTVIEALVKSKLMTGDGNGHFRPGEGITREEMAVLLVRAAGLQPATGDKLPVKDRDQISAWAKGYVQTALENGLLNGDGTNFNPQAKALRQEMAKMVFNLYNRDTNNEQTLSEIGNGTVVINGTTYKVGTQLAGLLRPTNSAALTGAKLTFVAEQGTITKITHLALTSSGHEATTGQPEFSGNLVLDGDGNSIEGNLEITGDYISLKNLTVSGDFLIAPTYAHDFYSKNLQVLGSTLVRGGDSNTVVFEDAKLHVLTLDKPDVRVEPKGSTTLSEVVISKNGTLAADASVQIPKLTIDAGVNQVSLGATTKIDTLVLPQGSNVTALLPNANLQNIAHFSEKKADGTTAPLPNPSTPPVVIGGGGGGGYVPTPTPTPTPTESVAVQSVRAINTSTVEVTFTKPTSPQWISFDHGLEVLAINLYNPQPQTTLLISTTPQQAGVSYEVSLNGTKSGKTFQGIATQVTGMLRHENGQPAEVHNLYVEDADTHEQVAFTVTGHGGHFALSGLTEGKAYLLSYPVGSDLIEVSPGPLAFTYQAGMAPLELSFTKPALQGRIVTPDGAPVQNVLVSINYEMYITNPDGYYFLGGLTPSDTYSVSVAAPTESVYASPEDTEFTYSQTMKEIPDIKLQVPNITGVLMDEDGHPLAGRHTMFFGPYHPILATTDSQGRFKFYGSKDNSHYSVRALVGKDDSYAEPIDASFQLSNGTADPVRMVLPKATIKGKITDSAGQPVSGAYLKFKNAQDAVVYTIFSQTDGSFKAGGFPDGDYKLEVINFSDVVYTGTVTSTKGEVHQKDITIQMMDTTPPVLQSTGPGWEYMYAGEPLSASLNEKGTVCLIPSTVQVNSVSDISDLMNHTQQSVYNHLSNEGGGEASLDTTNLVAGTYRMYAFDDQGNWSTLSDKVFTISHDKPPVFILSSKYGQHLPLNPSNRNFRDVPGNVTVGEVLDGLDLAPGVQATLFDFSFTPDEGKDPLQTMMPDHFEIELHSTTGGHAYYSYYFFNREQREPGLAVLGIDESVGLLNFDTSVYRGYESLNVYAGTTYNDLKNALKLTNETTAGFMVADLNQPVVAGFSFLISRGSWAEWITVNKIIEHPATPLTLTSTTLGTLETDAQGNFIAVREIPFGTETSDFLASLTLSNPSAHAELVNAPIGGTVESGPISHAMRLRISDENGGREFALHLADSLPLLNGLDPYRHAGQLIGGTISAPAHIKAGLLKLAAQVSPGSRAEILTGIGGAPVTDLLNTDVSSGMILRVTSWQGVTTDYQIVVTP